MKPYALALLAALLALCASGAAAGVPQESLREDCPVVRTYSYFPYMSYHPECLPPDGLAPFAQADPDGLGRGFLEAQP